MVYFWIASANVASHTPRRLHPPLFGFNLELWECLFLFWWLQLTSRVIPQNVFIHFFLLFKKYLWKFGTIFDDFSEHLESYPKTSESSLKVRGRLRVGAKERCLREGEWKKIWRTRQKEEKKERKEAPSENTRQPDPFPFQRKGNSLCTESAVTCRWFQCL